MSENEGDLTDGIITGDYKLDSPPPKREFSPWHRPRKQLVRDHQWCGQICKLLDDNNAISELRYFGLPGSDFLDIRHFHSAICQVRQLPLKFLGFNSAMSPNSKEHANLNVSYDEVRRLPLVDQKSTLLADNFALISNPRSVAWSKTQELGPFEVINLDLCDGICSPTAGRIGQSYYDAVGALFGLQHRRTQPWLLLLTTRVDQANIDDAILKKLLAKYVENLANCVSFQEFSSTHFTVGNPFELDHFVETSAGLSTVFLISVCKWLIGLALSHPTKIEVRSVFGYQVEPDAKGHDLVSIALRFSPIITPALDPMKLNTIAPSAPQNECAFATQAVKKVSQLTNIDKKLRDDPVLMTKMIQDSANLLMQARYDEVEYRSWVNNLA